MERKIDAWSFKPSLLCLALVAVLKFLCQLPGMVSFLLIPLTELGFVVAAVVLLVLVVLRMLRQQPRRSASAALVLLLPILLWWPTNWLVTVAHIGLTAGLGAGHIGRTQPTADDKFTVYDWSVGFAGGPNIFLIHDVTDEIALPLARHTQALSAEEGFGEECAGKVEHVIAHYYICTL